MLVKKFGVVLVLCLSVLAISGCSGPLAGKAVETGEETAEPSLMVISSRIVLGDGPSGGGRRGVPPLPYQVEFNVPAGVLYTAVEVRVSGIDRNTRYVDTIQFDADQQNRFVLPNPPLDRRQTLTFTLAEPLGEGRHTLVIDGVNPNLGQGKDDFEVHYVKLKNG